MMENSGCRFPSVGVECNEQMTKSSSGKNKRMGVSEKDKCVEKVSSCAFM